MKCLLTLAATALLCTVGAGLAPAAIAPTAHGSMVTGHSTPAPSSRSTTITTPAASGDKPPAAPMVAVASAADQATIGAATAKHAEQAMHAVLPNARDGFEVFDLQTGTVLTSRHADRQFAAMSVVKLLIALDALARNNWVTPDGETVYRYLTDQVPVPDRGLLLGALADAPRIAADGFNQYFGIPDGLPHTTWAIKQGWGTSGSQAVMESTGLVGRDLRYVVVVLASAPANSYSTVPSVITAGASALARLVSSAG